MLVVECPKRAYDDRSLDDPFYEYYAGYSFTFAESLVQHAPLDDDALILDPWNGAGTTPLAAIASGYRTTGIDLNPAMVVVAKGRLIGEQTLPSISPILDQVKQHYGSRSTHTSSDLEPLLDWFVPDTAQTVRGIERAISELLVGRSLSNRVQITVDDFSDIAAFFYTALFRAVRESLQPLRTSNPTWYRRPKSLDEKISADLPTLFGLLDDALTSMKEEINRRSFAAKHLIGRYTIKCGRSEALQIGARTVDMVLTSPPYCTRIDYAVATSGELAVLGYGKRTGFRRLRSTLMGTTTVPASAIQAMNTWGPACGRFVDKLASHRSVASDTYYLKNHLKYFESLSRSIAEIRRVLKKEGIATIVAQDSFYKEIHNDLPLIITEMSEIQGLKLFQRDNFSLGASIGNINKQSKKYVTGKRPVEAVLSFYRP